MPAWVAKHKRAKRVVLAALSAPPWVRQRDFAALVAERDLRSKVTGVPHVLAHIVPVDHPLVCGLTVPWNIKVMDKHANAREGNGLHWAFQGELLGDVEQLRLL